VIQAGQMIARLARQGGRDAVFARLPTSRGDGRGYLPHSAVSVFSAQSLTKPRGLLGLLLLLHDRLQDETEPTILLDLLKPQTMVPEPGLRDLDRTIEDCVPGLVIETDGATPPPNRSSELPKSRPSFAAGASRSSFPPVACAAWISLVSL